jgi:hypothetical protein
MSYTPPTAPAEPSRAFFQEAIAYYQLWTTIDALEGSSRISGHFIHPDRLGRPNFIVLVNNGLTKIELLTIKDLACEASYKVETTINEAVIVLSNLQKLRDNANVFTSTQTERE